LLDQLARIADPTSLLLVLGGALAAAALRSTRGDLVAALRALRACVRADPAAEGEEALAGVGRIERGATTRARASLDRIDQPCRFVAEAARAFADAADPAAFRLWAEDQAAALARRHARAQGVWRAVAEAAPAMGMIGTVIGLMGMFAAMDDVAGIGPAMALAMRTTLYGLVLSYGLAGPVAARLERLSAAEAEWRGMVTNRLLRLLQAEPAAPAQTPRRLRLVG